MIAANVVRQCIGLVSTIVLARLLTPADYGIVALSGIVVQFFDVFAQTGINQYILSRKKLEPYELNTAWTVRLCIRLVLALLLLITAPLIARFFNAPEMYYVLLFSACVPIIQSFENPGLLLLRRAMSYRSIALLLVVAKVAGFVIALTVAIQTRSYWALVIGEATAALSLTLLSYTVHKARPKISFQGFSTQWQFSKWTLARSIVGYTRARVDESIIGRYFTAELLGTYSLSKQLATLPHDHLTTSISDVLLSGIAADKKGSTTSICRLLVVQFSVLLPVTVGFITHADLVIRALLGDGWLLAIPVVQALAPITLALSLTTTVTLALVSMDRVKDVFVIDLCAIMIVIVTLISLASSKADLVTLSYFRTGLSYFTAFIFYLYINYRLHLPLNTLIVSLFPAIIASFFVHTTASVDVYLTSEYGVFVDLILIVMTSMAAYVLVFLVFVYMLRSLTSELAFIHDLTVKLCSSTYSRFSQ